MASTSFDEVNTQANEYGLTVARADRLRDEALIMHPGPMNRGVEISGEIADGERSVILEQVTNGVAVRMAVLYLLAVHHHKERINRHPASLAALTWALRLAEPVGARVTFTRASARFRAIRSAVSVNHSARSSNVAEMVRGVTVLASACGSRACTSATRSSTTVTSKLPPPGQSHTTFMTNR